MLLVTVYVGAFGEKRRGGLTRLPLVERRLDLLQEIELATGKIMQFN